MIGRGSSELAPVNPINRRYECGSGQRHPIAKPLGNGLLPIVVSLRLVLTTCLGCPQA